MNLPCGGWTPPRRRPRVGSLSCSAPPFRQNVALSTAPVRVPEFPAPYRPDSSSKFRSVTGSGGGVWGAERWCSWGKYFYACCLGMTRRLRLPTSLGVRGFSNSGTFSISGDCESSRTSEGMALMDIFCLRGEERVLWKEWRVGRVWTLKRWRDSVTVTLLDVRSFRSLGTLIISYAVPENWKCLCIDFMFYLE